MFALVVISFFLIMIGVTLTGLVLHQISKMNARLSRIEQALGCEESEDCTALSATAGSTFILRRTSGTTPPR